MLAVHMHDRPTDSTKYLSTQWLACNGAVQNGPSSIVGFESLAQLQSGRGAVCPRVDGLQNTVRPLPYFATAGHRLDGWVCARSGVAVRKQDTARLGQAATLISPLSKWASSVQNISYRPAGMK